MGILDDAIREHLELKRQHGAGEGDLERLEQEAFGPAARPGDPDFATGEEPVVGTPPAEEPRGEGEQEPAAAVEVAEPAPEEQPLEAPAEDEPPSGGFGVFDAESELGEEPREIAADATPAEQARLEHAHLGDTADHPAPTQLGPEDEAEPVPSEPAPSAEAPAAVDETEIDVTEPIEPGPPAAGGESPPAASPTPEEAAIEAPEAPEADIFADEDFGLADVDLSIEDDDSEPPPAVPGAAPPAAPGAEGDDEDLLEETPDFLQESEGEDLWFEQGPPRDFDFDDD